MQTLPKSILQKYILGDDRMLVLQWMGGDLQPHGLNRGLFSDFIELRAIFFMEGARPMICFGKFRDKKYECIAGNSHNRGQLIVDPGYFFLRARFSNQQTNHQRQVDVMRSLANVETQISTCIG
ncbi:MAG: hypothetical protein CFH10_00898 [Alphaproteobacteria bacterium MarineAlpha4_Bin2]|nr:MAG: hypothetical protein CFH10_00898 [Alphaproteobacteria bacterium MarineAlpha4_Bin2]